MVVWLINPYGPIPGEGWRDYRFKLLGDALAARGHEVVWWTANFSHHFKKFRSTGWEDRHVSERFRIRLVPTTAYHRNIGWGRLAFEWRYARAMYRAARALPRPDCIVGTDPSQLVGKHCVQLAREHHAALVLDIFDLWPELFALAVPQPVRWASAAVFSPLRALRRSNLAQADAIVALCQAYLAMARRETPGFGAKPSAVFYNGIDVTQFRLNMQSTGPEGVSLTKAAGDLWAIHAGSLGNNYDIPTLIRAAELLQESPSRAHILVAGDGPLRPEVERAAAARPNGRIHYLGKISPAQLARLYSRCDIGLCPYAPGSNVAMPDKAYDYTAAGLPFVNSLPGELAALLREEGLGLPYEAGNARSLCAAIHELEQGPSRRAAMASASYAVGQEFDAAVQYGRYATFVERIWAGSTRAATV